MKRVIQFSKLFLPMVILSAVVIASGIVALFVRGVNLGVDFQAGLVEQVRIAPQAFAAPTTSPMSVRTSLSPAAEAIMRSVVWPSTEARPLNGMFQTAFFHRASA